MKPQWIVLFLLFACLSYVHLAAEEKAVYLTWQKNPESSMVVRWVTPKEDTTSVISYWDEEGEGEEKSTEGTFWHLPEEAKNFLVHQVILTDLNPDHSYSFTIGRGSCKTTVPQKIDDFAVNSEDQLADLRRADGGLPEWAGEEARPELAAKGRFYGVHEFCNCLCKKENKVYRFRTAPKNLDKPLRFIAGGDVYHGSKEILERMNRVAAKFSPLFALVGGDIAYATPKDVRKPEDWERWLLFITSWTKTMVTPEGYMIPMLTIIGNEDTKGRHNQTPAQAPFYYSLFGFRDDPGYRMITFTPSIAIWLLDSGHTHAINEEQSRWLYHSLEANKEVPFKFAIYHVPAFPSVRGFHYPISEMIRKYWVPSFEAFGLTAAFENHDHAYKRTYPIMNRKIDKEGVTYLGDGGWAVYRPRVPEKPKDRWYLAASASRRNVVVVTVDPNKAHLMAIDDEGNVFDQITLLSKASANLGVNRIIVE